MSICVYAKLFLFRYVGARGRGGMTNSLLNSALCGGKWLDSGRCRLALKKSDHDTNEMKDWADQQEIWTIM
jgi:hypothetical protein